MNDPLIFLAGSVVFITTAWAAFAFGLARFDELARRDQQAELKNSVIRNATRLRSGGRAHLARDGGGAGSRPPKGGASPPST